MTKSNIYTNAQTIAQHIKVNDNFVICGHVSPDGDCLGSQLALCHALKILGKKATCLLVKRDSIDQGLSFLPGIDEMVVVSDYSETPSVFIACDVPQASRMGEAASRLLQQSVLTLGIDHHQSEEPIAQFTYARTEAASATLMVWEVIKCLGIEPTPEIATCTYTGLVTDTGRFQFQNTNEEAFSASAQMVRAGVNPADISRSVFQNRRLASLKLEERALSRMQCNDGRNYVISYLKKSDYTELDAVKADSEPIINTLRSLENVQVVCMLREDASSVRGSFRAKDKTDVAALAQQFGGGGHKAAAGFTLHTSLDKALEQVKEMLDDLFSSSKRDVE